MNRRRSGAAEARLMGNMPPNPINLNPKPDIDAREKAILFVDSKPFLFLATLLTFGIYYAYYKFCVAVRREEGRSQSNPPEMGEVLGERGRKFLEFQSLQNFSDGYDDLLSGKGRRGGELQRRLRMKKNNFLVAFGVLFTGLMGLLENGFTRITGRALEYDSAREKQSRGLERHVARERKILDHMSRLLNPVQPTLSCSFDLDSRIVGSLACSGQRKMVSHYMRLIFFWIYLLISLLSLGIIPLANRLRRKKWGFFSIGNDGLNIGLNCFNERLGRLLNCGGFGRFSEFLTREEQWNFSGGALSDLFRTKAFRHPRARRAVIYLLSLFSFGVFSFFIYLSRALGDRGTLGNLSEEKINPQRPEKQSPLAKICFLVSDVFWDLRIFVNLCLDREFKIIEGFRNSSAFKDGLMSFVFRLLTNPLSIFLSHLSLLLLSFIPTILLYPTLQAFAFVFPMLFLCLNAKHIDLFFL